MTKIYHTLKDGRIVEVRNWIMKPRACDSIVVRPLDEADKTQYLGLKNAGLSDSQIFFRLNPNILDRRKEIKTVEVPMEILDEKQLIWLIERDIGQKLRSLSRGRLVRLFLALSK
jgi:hypothetical protein